MLLHTRLDMILQVGGYFNDKSEGVHLWTIQDAKDGDVLITKGKPQPFIFKKYDEDTDYVYAYCGICDLVKDDSFYANGNDEDDQLWTCYSVDGDVYPATKEQCDTLDRAMTNAGYRWDKEKKELKKIKQKTAYSEEDEHWRQKAIDFMKHPDLIKSTPTLVKDTINWLKLLKDRYTWKPSEEQLKALHDINLTGNISYAGQGQTLIELYNDLKKLKGE